MTKMQKIEQELVKATGLQREKGESAQDWALRVAKAVGKISDEKFDKLSEEAADWYDAAVKAVKSKADLPELGEEESDEPAPRRRARIEDDEEEAPAKKDDEPPAKKKKKDDEDETPAPKKDKKVKSEDDDEPPAKKKEEPKEEPPAKKKKDKPASQEVSKHDQFRELVIKNFGASREALLALADENGIEMLPSSCSVTIYHTERTLLAAEKVFGIKLPRPGKKD